MPEAGRKQNQIHVGLIVANVFQNCGAAIAGMRSAPSLTLKRISPLLINLWIPHSICSLCFFQNAIDALEIVDYDYASGEPKRGADGFCIQLPKGTR